MKLPLQRLASQGTWLRAGGGRNLQGKPTKSWDFYVRLLLGVAAALDADGVRVVGPRAKAGGCGRGHLGDWGSRPHGNEGVGRQDVQWPQPWVDLSSCEEDQPVFRVEHLAAMLTGQTAPASPPPGTSKFLRCPRLSPPPSPALGIP